ncbi:MAG: glycosyltransferase [Planctomycetota bacterium]
MPPSPEVSPRPSTPLRVGYVIPEFPGQTHVWMWREIVHLREAGAEVHLFSTRRPTERDRARHGFADAARAETTYLWPMSAGQILGDVTRAKLRHPLGWLKAVRLAATLPVDGGPAVKTVLPLLLPACRLAREVQRRGITHLHSHTCANSAVLCMLVRELTCVPYSMTLNANVEWWGGAMAEKFGRAQFTVAITAWLERQVREQFPLLRDDQLILGRIGVDTLKWHPPVDRPADDGGPLRIISVGRLHPSKGYDVLLDALRRLDGRGVAFDLTLIGDGPQRGELEAKADTLGLADRVTFTGSLGEDAIIEHMQHADVFVLSSHAEPLGVVTMEAMAMEVAAVATDAGGVGEIVTDGVDGLLVPPEDAAAMASALQKLTEDSALRRRLAAAGRRTIVERFDSRRGAATLFEKLTGRRPDAMLSVLDEAEAGASAPAEREVA